MFDMSAVLCMLSVLSFGMCSNMLRYVCGRYSLLLCVMSAVVCVGGGLCLRSAAMCYTYVAWCLWWGSFVFCVGGPVLSVVFEDTNLHNPRLSTPCARLFGSRWVCPDKAHDRAQSKNHS